MHAATIVLFAAIALTGASAAPRVVPDVVVARDVQSAFAGDAWLGKFRLAVQVRDGVVELSGEVSGAHQRARAARLAAAVPGVVSVRNHIRVRTARTRILGAREAGSIGPASRSPGNQRVL